MATVTKNKSESTLYVQLAIVHLNINMISSQHTSQSNSVCTTKNTCTDYLYTFKFNNPCTHHFREFAYMCACVCIL